MLDRWYNSVGKYFVIINHLITIQVENTIDIEFLWGWYSWIAVEHGGEQQKLRERERECEGANDRGREDPRREGTCAPTNRGGMKHFSCRFPQSPRANPSANIVLSPRYTYTVRACLGDEKFDLVKFVLRLTPVELYCFMSDHGVFWVIFFIYYNIPRTYTHRNVSYVSSYVVCRA